MENWGSQVPPLQRTAPVWCLHRSSQAVGPGRTVGSECEKAIITVNYGKVTYMVIH